MPHSVPSKELDAFGELSLMTRDGDSSCLGCSRLDWAKTHCGKQWCVEKCVI